MSNHRRRLIVVSLATLLLQLFPPGVPVRAQGQRLVLAFYYAWYDEKTWSYDQVPDMPLSPYRSADVATIERHVEEARSAGIDALVQAWYGPGTNQTEGNFRTLLDVAQARGMRATVDFETGSPYMTTLDALAAGLRHLIDVHARHPAFLRYGERPVIFFWQQQRLSIEQWASFRAQVDPNHDTIWIADGDDARWLDVFDGLHMYMITWRVNTNPLYTATKMRKRIDEYVATHGAQRYWVATAMPGYDDTHVAGRAHPYAYPRSPEYYRSTWEAAMASTPEMVVITSYNEWREGTMIEPSVTYGQAYLELTREMAARYKGSQHSVPAATWTATPSATPTQAATPTPSPTETPTPRPTATSTPSPTATSTPSPTATSTPSPTPTFTPSPTATFTPSPTATATRTKAPTASPTAAATDTPTATQTRAVAYRSTATVRPSPTASRPPVPSSSGPACLPPGILPVGLIGLVLLGRGRRWTRVCRTD